MAWVKKYDEKTLMKRWFQFYYQSFSDDWLVIHVSDGLPDVDIWITCDGKEALRAAWASRADGKQYVGSRPGFIRWGHYGHKDVIETLGYIDKTELIEGLLCNHPVALYLRKHGRI